MRTPVAFLIFRRPETTRRVFAEIARARPPLLLVVADGPASEADRAACAETRAIVENIDWPCEVRRCFSESNMGCRRRVSSGLDWVFQQVEEAIILEDDTVPHPSFFPFCEELLERYRADARVGHIGGTDHHRGFPRGDGSYYASRYTSIWGWATWRRCWQTYDVNLDAWPAVKAAARHRDWFATREQADYLAGVWDDIHAGRLDTWDAQWMFCRLAQRTISLVPNGNLITNIGFHAEATHTRDVRHPFALLPLHGVSFPLRHPARLLPDDAVDRRRAQEEFLRRSPWWTRLADALSNRHSYGRLLRRVPVVGRAWATWRQQRSDGRTAITPTSATTDSKRPK